MGEMVEAQTESSSAMNRRNLLKGAAAVGVGAAVWTVPSITSLGGTPAYADTCTSGFTNYALGSRNTACNCGNPPNDKFISYKELGTPCAGDGNALPAGFTAYLAQSAGGSPITDSGTCPVRPPNANTGAGVQANVPSGLFCKTVVRIYQGGQCGNVFDEFVGPILSGPGFYPLPDAPCQGGGNVFISVILRCSREEECL